LKFLNISLNTILIFDPGWILFLMYQILNSKGVIVDGSV
jgi:hypothetical protein